MLPIWLVAVLAIIATHRITRLITRDALPVIAVPRDAFARRWAVYEDAEDKHTSLSGRRTNIVMRSMAYLWECDWCASVWVGAGVAAATYHWHDAWWFQVVLLGAAASSVTGLIAQREPS